MADDKEQKGGQRGRRRPAPAGAPRSKRATSKGAGKPHENPGKRANKRDTRDRQDTPRQRDTQRAQDAQHKQWGSVARKGARVVQEPREGSASRAWRAAIVRARSAEDADEWQPERWIEADEPADGPAEPGEAAAKARDGHAGAATTARRVSTGARSRSRSRVPSGVAEQLAGAVDAKQAARLVERLADANRAYERDRFEDARRILKPLAGAAPQVAAVRRLLGLTAYHLGRWKEAVGELEAYHTLTAAYDEHPVLADSYRALGRHDKVAELWTEVRQASPSAEAVAEGRIVAAGSLADQGDLQAAIRLLSRSAGAPSATAARRRPKEHHLRQWYALADLYERAGDIPRARDLFNRIALHQPQSFDVDDRVRALR